MRDGEFSRTALGAAAKRAAHQTLDRAAIFVDPLAVSLTGEDIADELARGHETDRRRLRLFIALRSRIAEDMARRAIASDARQVVVLGAGLDTFGYRLSPELGLRVFEVDHPATQAEKRRRLAAASISIPPHLVYAPVDFERESLAAALAAADFDARGAAVFIWLGVTPYLTQAATLETLAFVATVPGAEIVFDYVNPSASIADDSRALHDRLEARVAALGEHIVGAWETSALHAELRARGFQEIEDFGPRAIRERLAPGAPPPPSDNGGHILRARRV